MGLAPSCPEVIMYLLNTHLGKEMDTFIFSQEKHIEPVAMGAYHSIPSLSAELLHRQ